MNVRLISEGTKLYNVPSKGFPNTFLGNYMRGLSTGDIDLSDNEVIFLTGFNNKPYSNLGKDFDQLGEFFGIDKKWRTITILKATHEESLKLYDSLIGYLLDGNPFESRTINISLLTSSGNSPEDLDERDFVLKRRYYDNDDFDYVGINSLLEMNEYTKKKDLKNRVTKFSKSNRVVKLKLHSLKEEETRSYGWLNRVKDVLTGSKGSGGEGLVSGSWSFDKYYLIIYKPENPWKHRLYYTSSKNYGKSEFKSKVRKAHPGWVVFNNTVATEKFGYEVNIVGWKGNERRSDYTKIDLIEDFNEKHETDIEINFEGEEFK